VATVDDRSFHLGDTVLATKNRYDLGILNGQRGTVIGTSRHGMEVRLDDDRHVQLPLDYVSEHLEHSYARTVHKIQGLTCDVALLLGDDTLYAELGYTGLTRGRLANYLYTVAQADDDLGHLARSLSTSRAKTAAVDYLDGVER
jgi:ATP-dependent exoDNAse (exonuclease V) alpha subunit